MKWARSVGEMISSLFVACFLVSLVHFYHSPISCPLTVSLRSVELDVQNSSALGNDYIISETTVCFNLCQKGNEGKNSKTTPILSCDLKNYRSAVCEIYSNVRIHGNSSSIFFTSDETMHLEANKTWQIRPYTRKFDAFIMKKVREVTIRPLFASTEAPKCNVDHNITAIVFASTGGSKKKPRLLIIARTHTRKMTNVGEIVAVSEELGFEVVVNDSSFHTNVDEQLIF
ncbi:hypothetical protein FCM35_KLT02850 [Carex littledalei]|uniref:Uncharacterized protein n=1 Tax=Carex littledalei TaxID=544730 RepID=A0A833R976_9POAL|nr:hypothetical protein FCM35_KLT02850 [Carex littledalei]